VVLIPLLTSYALLTSSASLGQTRDKLRAAAAGTMV
jgi:hypothetical protein